MSIGLVKSTSTPARLAVPVKPNDARLDFMRAQLQHTPEGILVSPSPRQDSAVQTDFAGADALLLRAPFAPAGAAGDGVDIIRMGDIGL